MGLKVVVREVSSISFSSAPVIAPGDSVLIDGQKVACVGPIVVDSFSKVYVITAGHAVQNFLGNSQLHVQTRTGVVKVSVSAVDRNADIALLSFSPEISALQMHAVPADPMLGGLVHIRLPSGMAKGVIASSDFYLRVPSPSGEVREFESVIEVTTPALIPPGSSGAVVFDYSGVGVLGIVIAVARPVESVGELQTCIYVTPIRRALGTLGVRLVDDHNDNISISVSDSIYTYGSDIESRMSDPLLQLDYDVELSARRFIRDAEIAAPLVEKFIGSHMFLDCPIYSCTHRIKSLEATVARVLRRKAEGNDKYGVTDVSDLVGFRYVTIFESDIAKVAERILSMFLDDPGSSSPFDQNSEIFVTVRGLGSNENETSMRSMLNELVRHSKRQISVVWHDYAYNYSYVSVSAHCLIPEPSLPGRRLPIEFQILSVASQVWGQIDHKLRYRSRRGNINNSSESLDELKKQFDILNCFLDSIKERFLN